ncbi:MAG: GIY-YIG nuclease family protein [Myxococcales bacterium]|nr:GIY-YIG nuclease family protein [Myxococcales bacterium]
MFNVADCFRRVFLVYVLLVMLPARQAAAQANAPAVPLPVLRMPNLAVGTRCFGFLPCTQIDRFGLRLRAAALVAFRPERAHERDLYAARIQLTPSITLMEWAELGVAIPITLYKKDSGVAPIYEPLAPFGRVRIPLEGLLGNVATTAFVRVPIVAGPFVGGSPATTTDLPYRPASQFELGLALHKRIGPISASAALAAAVAQNRVEISGGGELSYRFSILTLFVQGHGVGIPKCPKEEADLNFCASGFRFAAGARFTFDLGQGGLFVGAGGGSVEPGWMIGGQFGLDYDEGVRRMHGDGHEAAQRWWQARFDAASAAWARWRSAAAVWHEDEVVAARRVLPTPGIFTPVLGAQAPPQSPWLDQLLDDAPHPFPSAPVAPAPASASTGSTPSSASTATRANALPRSHAAHPRRAAPHNALKVALADARRGQVPPVPGFIVGWDDPNKLRDAELAQLAWQVERERQTQHEQERWRQSPALPPMEKVMLNWVATAPARGVLGLLAMSGPGRRAEAEEQMRKLRPLPCSPAEEEACGAVETMLDQTVLLLGPAAAETALVRGSTLLAAREAAAAAGRGAEFAAAEAAALAEAGAAEVGESAAPRFAGLLDRFTARLNPTNYRVCGVNCGAGGIEFRPPRLPTSAATDEAAGTLEDAVGAVAEHEAPVLGQVQTGSSRARGIYEFPDQTTGGKPYVGQSSNLPQRLKQHEGSGRLIPGTERTTPVDGGKTAREIAEHQRIQEITRGEPARLSPNVANKVDPIGPSRQHLLDRK